MNSVIYYNRRLIQVDISQQEYIAPELFLLLMTSLFTFYVVYFPLSFFAVYIIIFLLVVPFTYVVRGKVRLR